MFRDLRKLVEGKYWDILTAANWIRYHKTKYALWLLGERGQPVTRFTNLDEVQLVMRGTGNSPPRTLEEDREFLKTEVGKLYMSKAKASEVQEALKQARKARKEAAKQKKEKLKKRSLPWSGWYLPC